MQIPVRSLRPGLAAMPVLSIGSWHTWDRMDFGEAVETAALAVRRGARLFDVGNYNMGPHDEKSHTDVIFGRVVQAAGLGRGDYLLSQKLWLWEYPDHRLGEQLDRALCRVGADRADLVILGDFPRPIDIPKMVTEVAELVRSGRTGCWGVNNWAAADVTAAYVFATAEGMPAPALAQLKYSVCRRSVPEGTPYRRVLGELGLRLQASDVLEGGILAGHAEPARRIGADPGGIRPGIRAAAPRLAAAARALRATPAQVAIAFCLANPAVASVLVGVSSRAQLVENLGAVDLAARHGGRIRDLAEPLWLDAGAVSPDASWGAAPGGMSAVPCG